MIGCHEASPQADPSSTGATVTGRYQINIRWTHVVARHRITLNGFPVDEEPVLSQAVNNSDRVQLNTALVGTGNELAFQFEPRITAGTEDVYVGPVRFEAVIAHAGKRVAAVDTAVIQSVRSAWAERADGRFDSLRSVGVGRPAALDSVRVWARAHPMTVSVTFDNAAGPDFSALFKEAPVITGTAADSARLRDYAMQLHHWIAAGHTQKLYEALQPSLSREIGFFRLTASPDRASALEVLRERWVAEWPNHDIDTDDVVLQKWSGGRVWELAYRTPDGRKRPLFDWHERYLRAYVAEIDGELRVVRV